MHLPYAGTSGAGRLRRRADMAKRENVSSVGVYGAAAKFRLNSSGSHPDTLPRLHDDCEIVNRPVQSAKARCIF
jgi:hypothetical protein